MPADKLLQQRGGNSRLTTALWLLIGALLLVFDGNNAGAEAGGAEDSELRAFLERSINTADTFEDRYDAEVWLVDMSQRLAPFIAHPGRRVTLLEQIHRAATRAQLPPELVLSVIHVESRFDRFAVSRAGAQGLMQVMPFWKHEIGRPDDNLTHNETNLEYGCYILQYYLQRESGDLVQALAAYNGSSGSRRYSDKVYRAWRNYWRNGELDWTKTRAWVNLPQRSDTTP